MAWLKRTFVLYSGNLGSYIFPLNPIGLVLRKHLAPRKMSCYHTLRDDLNSFPRKQRGFFHWLKPPNSPCHAGRLGRCSLSPALRECKSETAMFAFAPWHWVMSLAKTLLQYCFKSLQYFRVVSKSSRSQKRSSHIFPPSLDRNSWVFGWWFEICLCSMLTSMMIRLVDVCAWNGPTRFWCRATTMFDP